MSYLEVGGRRYPVPAGEMVIGSDPGGHIVLAGVNVAPRHALVRATPDGQVSIHKAEESVEVLVNGVRLGAQPTPLLHGDRVLVGGFELRFGDERRSGSTQFLQVDEAPFAPKGGGAKGAGGGGTSGGRLVSLTDGREYAVGAGSLVIGRSTDCDVVLTSRNVSRRHAEILQTDKGYLVVDSSTNGTFVNGERVEGQRLLARADVIRCGDDEFRFYADVLPEAPPAETVAAVGGAVNLEPFMPDPSRARGEGQGRIAEAPPAPAAPPPAAAPPPGAVHQLRDTLFGVPGVKVPGAGKPAREEPTPPERPAPPRKEPQPLANLVVRSGALKGQRFAVRVPVVNIGRAEYNDIVIADPSVSTSHAKLQRREGIWVVVDLESTNGTRVDGEPVRGEAPLAPGARVQFGSVEMLFEPTDDTVAAQPGGGTQFIESLRAPEPESGPKPPLKPEPERPTREAAPRNRSSGGSANPVARPPTALAPGDRTGRPAPREGPPPSTSLVNRVIWGLLVLVVLVVVLIVFAG